MQRKAAGAQLCGQLGIFLKSHYSHNFFRLKVQQIGGNSLSERKKTDLFNNGNLCHISRHYRRIPSMATAKKSAFKILFFGRNPICLACTDFPVASPVSRLLTVRGMKIRSLRRLPTNRSLGHMRYRLACPQSSPAVFEHLREDGFSSRSRPCEQRRVDGYPCRQNHQIRNAPKSRRVSVWFSRQ